MQIQTKKIQIGRKTDRDRETQRQTGKETEVEI